MSSHFSDSRVAMVDNNDGSDSDSMIGGSGSSSEGEYAVSQCQKNGSIFTSCSSCTLTNHSLRQGLAKRRNKIWVTAYNNNNEHSLLMTMMSLKPVVMSLGMRILTLKVLNLPKENAQNNVYDKIGMTNL